VRVGIAVLLTFQRDNSLEREALPVSVRTPEFGGHFSKDKLRPFQHGFRRRPMVASDGEKKVERFLADPIRIG
jgi:hypothetical protein